jgi:hypothetical protein
MAKQQDWLRGFGWTKAYVAGAYRAQSANVPWPVIRHPDYFSRFSPPNVPTHHSQSLPIGAEIDTRCQWRIICFDRQSRILVAGETSILPHPANRAIARRKVRIERILKRDPIG